MEDSQEYFFGAELTKENPTYTWTFEEEEEDSDFLIHTLFLKHAVLGSSALKDERNVVTVETKNFEKTDLKQPLFSLTLGLKDMCNLEISFGHETPVTFRLAEGTGPVCLSGQQLVEFPDESNTSQEEESMLDTEESEEGGTEEEKTPKKLKSQKRKASKLGAKKSKGKMDVSGSSANDSMEDEEEDEEDEEDEDEEDFDEEMDEEDVESSPEKSEKKKAKKGGKRDFEGDGKPKALKKSIKGSKISPGKKAKKAEKAGGKKAKK